MRVVMSPKHRGKGEGGSVAQYCAPAPLSDTLRAKKKGSTPIASDRTADKGGADKNIKTSNKNLHQGYGGRCDMDLLRRL